MLKNKLFSRISVFKSLSIMMDIARFLVSNVSNRTYCFIIFMYILVVPCAVLAVIKIIRNII